MKKKRVSKNKKLPDDDVLLEMLKEYKTIREVLIQLGINYRSCPRLVKIARENGLIREYKRRDNTTNIEKEEVLINNHYKEYDSYELKQTIELEGHKWTIDTVTGKSSKLYHCINELGLRGSFDCLQLKRGAIVC